MTFGQVSGPPAQAKQLAVLTDLLDQQGYGSFKEARHPFGLTQRQAAGRFTTAEADELIERLTAAAEVRGDSPGSGAVTGRELERQEELVVGLAAEVLATELTNRGWCCIPPPAG